MSHTLDALRHTSYDAYTCEMTKYVHKLAATLHCDIRPLRLWRMPGSVFEVHSRIQLHGVGTKSWKRIRRYGRRRGRMSIEKPASVFLP